MAKRFTRNVLNIDDVDNYNLNGLEEMDMVQGPDDTIYIKSNNKLIDLTATGSGGTGKNIRGVDPVVVTETSSTVTISLDQTMTDLPTIIGDIIEDSTSQDNRITIVEGDITNINNELDDIKNTPHIESVVAGTNVTVDNTDPLNPIVSASGGSGGTGIVETIVAGTNITVNSTDPANPIVSATTDKSGLMYTEPFFLSDPIKLISKGDSFTDPIHIFTGNHSQLTATITEKFIRLSGYVTTSSRSDYFTFLNVSSDPIVVSGDISSNRHVHYTFNSIQTIDGVVYEVNGSLVYGATGTSNVFSLDIDTLIIKVYDSENNTMTITNVMPFDLYYSGLYQFGSYPSTRETKPFVKGDETWKILE